MLLPEPKPAADTQESMGVSYWLGWSSFRLLFATYFRWRYYHPERVPPTGPVILASNHESFLDPPLVASGLKRPLNFLARDTLFRLPPMGALLRSWKSIPVDREGGGAAGVRAVLTLLEAGEAVILFPEGTRSRDGQLQRARSGVGLIAVRTSAPVVPVRVFGTYAAYGRNHRFPQPRRVAVKYGFPISFAAARAEARKCSKARLKELYQRVADEIMEAIARLQPCEDKTEFPG